MPHGPNECRTAFACPWDEVTCLYQARSLILPVQLFFLPRVSAVARDAAVQL